MDQDAIQAAAESEIQDPNTPTRKPSEDDETVDRISNGLRILARIIEEGRDFFAGIF